jgi:mannose-6-phosphate isomerase-like protein (cupin superfamily)
MEKISVKEAINKLEASGDRSIRLFSQGGLEVKVYSPIVIDTQNPHDRDEIYLVISGHGRFFCSGTDQAFEAGDCLFVEAGAEHRFVDFSPDFVTWVFFFGPKGGESAASR